MLLSRGLASALRWVSGLPQRPEGREPPRAAALAAGGSVGAREPGRLEAVSAEDWRLDSSSTFRGTPWVLWGWGERLLTGRGERGTESDPGLRHTPPCPAPLPWATHLDVLHQLRLLQEQQRALGALEDAHLALAGILVKMLLNVSLLVEDHFTGALINEPAETSPGA